MDCGELLLVRTFNCAYNVIAWKLGTIFASKRIILWTQNKNHSLFTYDNVKMDFILMESLILKNGWECFLLG